MNPTSEKPEVEFTDVLDAFELLHHLRQYWPKTTVGLLEQADMSDERFAELLALVPARWDDGWKEPLEQP